VGPRNHVSDAVQISPKKDALLRGHVPLFECCTGWSKKVKPLRLKAHIFKMPEPVCMIFGTFQQCFVLNTSVTSISNKFIIQVAQPGDKINNEDFYLQNVNWHSSQYLTGNQ